MNKVHVILHIQTSIDARADGFETDMGTYYQLAETFSPDAFLSGADTMIKGRVSEDVPDWAYEVAKNFPSCSRSIMAIVDSKGRVRNWNALKKQPFWRMPVALCSRSTPEGHLEYLNEENVDVIIAGEERVDLKEALMEMNKRYGVKTVRVDSGGTLSAALLREGLIDELSVIVTPCIVGGLSTNAMFSPSMLKPAQPIVLRLKHVEDLKNGTVWLKYDIDKKD